MSLKIGVKVANRVVPEPYPVETERFGVKISNLLGTVDADGNYLIPTEPVVLDLTGVKSLPAETFMYFCYNKKVNQVLGNDLQEIGRSAFEYAFAYAHNVKLSMDSIEEISNDKVFFGTFRYVVDSVATFSGLKRIAGNSVFESFAAGYIDPSSTFPVLEEVTGRQAFATFCEYEENDVFVFEKLKKIIGGTAYYYSMFGALYYNNVRWYFPSATEVVGYLWGNSNAVCEIHFAEKNRAAIEACEGYSYKWGASKAEIFFDL